MTRPLAGRVFFCETCISSKSTPSRGSSLCFLSNGAGKPGLAGTESESVYDQSLAEYGNKKSKKLNWDAALDLMLKNNLELKRARDSLERAVDNRKQIYWDLVPSLGLSASLSKSLTDLGDLSSRDIRFNAFSTINLPGMISFYSRRYASCLARFWLSGI